jgi:hypothetical protein
MAAVAGNSKLFGWISGLGMLSKAGSSCESELNGVCVCFFCLMALFFFGTISGWHLCAGFRHKAVEGGERLKKKDEHKYESPSKQETSQLSISCLFRLDPAIVIVLSQDI